MRKRLYFYSRLSKIYKDEVRDRIVDPQATSR